MPWELRKTYLYLVSLVTFVAMLLGAYRLAATGIEYLAPMPERQYPCDAPLADGTVLKGEALAECERHQRLLAADHDRERQRMLLRSVGHLLVTIPAYLYHWRMIRPQHTKAS